MRRMRKSSLSQEAELDITAFMNLMIVLVPVLLLGMVFSQITVLDIKLPDAADATDDADNKKKIELLVREQEILVNYPRGIVVKRIPKIDVVDETILTVQGAASVIDANATTAKDYDYALLSLVLQEIKRQLREKSIDNKAITILSEPNTSYQTIVTIMDTVRSYKAVVALSVVDAELFPQVSFGDAPEPEAATTTASSTTTASPTATALSTTTATATGGK